MITFPLDSLIIGKNEEYGYPIVDRPYTAEQMRKVYKTFFSNGVFMNEPDAFHVTPGEGMNVIVSAGTCIIEGAVGYEEAPRQLAVQAASTTADRIDTVVLRLNLNVEVRNIDLYVKTGTAQDVPVRPTLTRSESVWELGIGDLFIAKNTGAISSARITDTRLQTDRCGAVTPFATIDTTTFFDQIQAAIDENVATLQEQTQVAVELAQSAIDGTTAGNLQNQITANKEAIESNKEEEDGRWASIEEAAQDDTSGTIMFDLGGITFLAFSTEVLGTGAHYNVSLPVAFDQQRSFAIIRASQAGVTQASVGYTSYRGNNIDFYFSNGLSDNRVAYVTVFVVGIKADSGN